MKKLFKRIACIFLGHNLVFQFQRKIHDTSKTTSEYLIYRCERCGKYKNKKINKFKF